MSVTSETNSSGEDDLSDEGEELDPRIQDGLEKLNAATNSINHLESELDEARAVFRQTMAAATYHLNHQAQKLGKCVDKARPYYESLRELRFSHQNLHKSALQFERANGMHVAAKARVGEAERRVFSGDTKLRPFDGALQEMLNQATMEVSEAAKQKLGSWERHQVSYKDYQKVQEKVRALQKKLSGSIDKAKPYFVQKVGFDRHLWHLKLRVDSIHKGLAEAKATYSDCLRSLEAISDEIHQRRNDRKMIAMLAKLHERGAGVGADSSTEDDASLTQSQLDLDLDCNTSLSEIDGMVPGEVPSPGRATPARRTSEEAGSCLERTVTGSEVGHAGGALALEREVYGDESQKDENPEVKSPEGEPGPGVGDCSVGTRKSSDEKCQGFSDETQEITLGVEKCLTTGLPSESQQSSDPEGEIDNASLRSNSATSDVVEGAGDVIGGSLVCPDQPENDCDNREVDSLTPVCAISEAAGEATGAAEQDSGQTTPDTEEKTGKGIEPTEHLTATGDDENSSKEEQQPADD